MLKAERVHSRYVLGEPCCPLVLCERAENMWFVRLPPENLNFTF